MVFLSIQEYCRGLPFPSPGDLPDSGIDPASPVLADKFFTTEPPGKPPGDRISIHLAVMSLLSFSHVFVFGSLDNFKEQWTGIS